MLKVGMMAAQAVERAIFFLRVKILKDESERLARHPNVKINLTIEGPGILHVFKSPADWSLDVDNTRQESSSKKRQSLLGLTKHGLTWKKTRGGSTVEEQSLLKYEVDDEVSSSTPWQRGSTGTASFRESMDL